MSVAYGKGPKGKATRLHAQLVRSRGRCERCGSTRDLQCAHIIRRRYNATRTDEMAAWCLCAACHFLTEEKAHEFMALVERTIGVATYEELWERAHKGVKANEVFWREECDRLAALLKATEEAA